MNKKTKSITSEYYTTPQLNFQVEILKNIDSKDMVYSFSKIMDTIDLKQYFAMEDCKMGRPRYDSVKLLKVILFAFMEKGYESLRKLEKLCKTDIRYIWLLDGMKVPSFATFGNFMRNRLSDKIENIFIAINNCIFKEKNVDLEHLYIDGTKIEANANRYTWVWKRSCLTNRNKVFGKINLLLDEINSKELSTLEFKFEKREEYAIEYICDILNQYEKICNINKEEFVSGKGCRKKIEQKHYQKLEEYLSRLKIYAKHIEICGEKRNSYSKSDHDATFMRVKNDYMGNAQLLPSYNMQMGICDEYIAVVTAEKYASDMDCFVPLIDKFKKMYGKYPKYPVADAGYGSFNNYLYCEEHNMEKYMKFTMFDKSVKDKKYQRNPYLSVNFKKDETGNILCPNSKKFVHLKEVPIRGNKYDRTEELLICENCEGCPFRNDCHKGKGNRVIRVNHELTKIHKEVIENLESIHGALLRMNRSIQSEGTFGIIKWDRRYERVFRRGIKSIILEFTLISCGFNLYKYHNKRIKEI